MTIFDSHVCMPRTTLVWAMGVPLVSASVLPWRRHRAEGFTYFSSSALRTHSFRELWRLLLMSPFCREGKWAPQMNPENFQLIHYFESTLFVCLFGHYPTSPRIIAVVFSLSRKQIASILVKCLCLAKLFTISIQLLFFKVQHSKWYAKYLRSKPEPTCQ